MRPLKRFEVLTDEEVDFIIDGAMQLLEDVGMHVDYPELLDIFGQAGARVEDERAFLSRDLVERCLKTVPSRVEIFNQDREKPLVLEGDNVHFVSDAVVPYIFDEKMPGRREPLATDQINQCAVLNTCDHVEFGSGTFVISDMARGAAGAYRYYLALQYTPKPLHSAAFRIDDMPVIRDLAACMSGGEEELKKRPLLVISINPTSPMALSDKVSDNLMLCARDSIPQMLIPIPLAGGSSPMSLAGTVVQLLAENLGAMAAGQIINPGTPIVFGGGPAVLDMRRGAACQSAPEAQLMGAAYAQICRKLNVPKASNLGGRVDSRRIDYQAGQEFGNGAALMALAGVNMIRGPGGCEYGSVVSLEKLLLDNEVCGMALRLTEPMDVNDEQLALDVVRDVAKTRSFIDHPHTLKHFRELYMPSMQLIDRTSRGEFEDAKGPDAYTRAKVRVKEILDDEESYRTVDPDKKKEMDKIMLAFTKKFDVDKLPATGRPA